MKPYRLYLRREAIDSLRLIRSKFRKDIADFIDSLAVDPFNGAIFRKRMKLDATWRSRLPAVTPSLSGQIMRPKRSRLWISLPRTLVDRKPAFATFPVASRRGSVVRQADAVAPA